MDTSRLKLKATLPAKRRPDWQTALLWFGGGMALACLAAFFLDGRRGEARRQMVVDTARDVRDSAQGRTAAV